MSYDELIDELSCLVGIIPEFWDIFGNRHITSQETKRYILKAIGIDISTPEQVKREIEDRKLMPWNRFIEPVKILSENEQPLKISVYIPVGDECPGLDISWTITDEKGNFTEGRISTTDISVSEERLIKGKRHIRVDLYDDIKRDIGYYSADVKCIINGRDIRGISRIIIAPEQCYMPEELKDSKTWGIFINLYSIKSRDNFGIGDFGDLKKIIEWVSNLKGGFVGINPLHAIPNKRPFGISPYSPISRLYKNFIYIDLNKVPDIEEVYEHGFLEEMKAEIERLKESGYIDYDAVARLKISALKKTFEIFYERHYKKKSDFYREFDLYLTKEGDLLKLFCVYLSLTEDHSLKSDNPYDWRHWDEEFRDSSNSKIQEYQRLNHKRILFYSYLQWLIHRQIREISDLSKNSMPIGIYHDLAIGSISGSFDTWINKDIFAFDADLGAPPDDFNPDGQNWGFPPIIPERLRDQGYEFFIKSIRENMVHFGALRIDHALGMFRQFWIPKGMHASSGAYVKQFTEDLLRIIALESVRNKTIVVAEDLGTIGENVAETLLRFRMLSYRLLYFQRNYPDPSFLTPERYPEMALCSVTTHDLPTIDGWWICRDIEIKKRLNLYKDEESVKRDICNRERDKELLIKALKEAGLLDLFFEKPLEMSEALRLAIYEYLSKTPCKLLCVNLDDIIGTIDQQNMPGVLDEYPSWRQKTTVSLEEILCFKPFLELPRIFKERSLRS